MSVLVYKGLFFAAQQDLLWDLAYHPDYFLLLTCLMIFLCDQIVQSYLFYTVSVISPLVYSKFMNLTVVLICVKK
jgi:hypothetical protein